MQMRKGVFMCTDCGPPTTLFPPLIPSLLLPFSLPLFCSPAFPRLQVGSEVAERDIVQFVPFRNFAHVSLAGTLSNKMTIEQLSMFFTPAGLS